MAVRKLVVRPACPGCRLLIWPGRAGLFLLLVLSRVPQAQQQLQDQIQGQSLSSGLDQLAPSPMSVTPQTTDELAHPGEFQVFPNAGPAPDSLDQPFQWGTVVFRPHLLYSFMYGNGVQSAPGVQNKTIIQTLSVGMLVNLGSYWVLDYTPTLRYYSGTNFQNGFDQSVILRGGKTYENWRLGLSQSYTTSSSPTVETGTQVNQASYVTALTASYELNNIMSMDLTANQDIEDAQALASSRTWSSLDWLNFKLTSALNLGVGGGGGYVDEQTGPSQTYEQLESRIGWRVSDKVSLQANAGFEDSQFSGSSRGALISPLYGASLEYQMFQNTSIGLTAQSSTSPSLFDGLVSQNTTYGATLSQRLLGKLNLSLGANYSTVDYLSSTTTAAGGSQNYTSYNARLSCPLLQRGSFGITYQYSHTQSSATQNLGNYNTTQIGFFVGYTY
jgi:hypothetical protein